MKKSILLLLAFFSVASMASANNKNGNLSNPFTPPCELSITISPTPAPSCPGTTIYLYVNNPPTGVAYTWSFGNRATVINGSGSRAAVKFNTCGTYSVTVTGTSAIGCSGTATKTVSVVDNTAPVITGIPSNISVNCKQSIPAIVQPIITDNCDTKPTVVFKEAIASVAPGSCLGVSARIWTATDKCGNVTTFTQTIYQNFDTTPPTLNGVPANVTLGCSTLPVQAITITATDNCPNGNPVISFNEVRTAGSCPDNYTLIRTWTATDRCGNKATKTQVITVQDTQAPTLAVPASVTLDCGGIIPNGSIFQAFAVDNCDKSVTISFAQAIVDPGPGACNTTGRIYSWTAEDNCANKVTKNQYVIVKDISAPILYGVPANITIACNSPMSAPANVIAKDACSPTLIPVRFSTSTIAVNGAYTIKRTWTATDPCGNVATKTQTITTIDRTPPVFTTTLPYLSVSCPPDNIVVPRATDNCDNDVEVTNVVVISNKTCNNRYTSTSTWTAKDDAGNITTMKQVMVVNDMTPPTILGVPANITLACGQTPTIPIVAIAPELFGCPDNPTLTLKEERFTAADVALCPGDIRTIIYTWTAKDGCTNVSTATWRVDFIPNTPNANNKIVSGIKTNNEDFQLLPNPTTGQVLLNFNNSKVSKVEIYDVTGRQILSSDNNGNDNLQLDLSSEQKGIYHVKVYTENGIVTKRLILIE